MKYQFRLFLSSTFYDMDKERKYFQDVIFPEVDEYCHQRHVEFIPIDLRWGVNDDMRLVLQTCFNEIDNSRPFFIGIIGHRYGSLPKKEAIAVARELLQKKKPDIPQTIIVEGESVTEMEIDYGLWNTPPFSAVFLLRDKINSIETERDEEKEELRKRQDALRKRIDESVYPTHPYSTLEQYGQLLQQTIINFINSRFTGDELTDFYAYNQQLIEDNSTNSLIIPEAHKRIQKWYFSGVPVLFCDGDPRGASGWTTFLCQFLHQHQQKEGKALYIDCSSIYSHNQQYSFLMNYIEKHISQNDKNAIVCIEHFEALNRMTMRKMSYFINQHIPYIRFIITRRPVSVYINDGKCLWCTCPVEHWDELYNEEDRFAIAKFYLKRYGKVISDAWWNQIRAIGHEKFDKIYGKYEPQLGNILTAIQVVQGLDPIDVPQQLARGIIFCQSEIDLCYWIAEMLYKRANRYNILEKVKRVIILLAIARYKDEIIGLTEADIKQMAHLDSTQLAMVRPFILSLCDVIEGNRYSVKWRDLYHGVIGDFEYDDKYKEKLDAYIAQNHLKAPRKEEKERLIDIPLDYETENEQYNSLVKNADIVINEAIRALPKDQKERVVKRINQRFKNYPEGFAQQMINPLLQKRDWSDDKILQTFESLYDWALIDESVAFHHLCRVEIAIAIIYKRKGLQEKAKQHVDIAWSIFGSITLNSLVPIALKNNLAIEQLLYNIESNDSLLQSS